MQAQTWIFCLYLIIMYTIKGNYNIDIIGLLFKFDT